MKAHKLLCFIWSVPFVAGLFSMTATGQSVYTEDFTTTTYKDVANTTATWDTELGKLRLPMLHLTSAGSYDTPGASAGVMVVGDLAFVADAGEGLMIIDITDPVLPSLLGSYDTPGNAEGVWIGGDWAYVCDDGFGLQIIDITDPAVPSLVGSYNTSGRALSVEVAGDYAFVADFGAGLTVVDISNSVAPTLAGSYDTPGFARMVDVEGNYAYVADRGGGGLQIIDITDPTTPVLAGSYNPGGDTWGVKVSGNVVYLGAASVGLVAVDVTDPSNPTPLSTIAAGSARRLDVSGDFVYVAGYSDVFVFDVTDPSNPALVHSYTTPGIASDVAVDGDHAYVADGADGGLLALECADPVLPPQPAGNVVTARRVSRVALSGNYAYTTGWASGLQVFDIGDPTSPSFAGLHADGSVTTDVAVSGDHAYVILGGVGLQVLDISAPATPTLVGDYTSFTLYPRAIAVDGDYAYVTIPSHGLAIFDISDPTAPYPVGNNITPDRAHGGVAVAGDHAYVADRTRLQIVDVSDPTNPTNVGSYSSPGETEWVHVEGDYAYVSCTNYTNDTGFLQVVDVSNPASPGPAVDVFVPGFASDVTTVGDYAFVALYDGPTGGGANGLQVFDISDPMSPALAATWASTSHGLGVAAAGNYAFLGNDDAGLTTLEVFEGQFDVFSNAAQSTVFGESNAPIKRARLMTTQADSIRWEISTVSGIWQEFIPGSGWQKFTDGWGLNLIWRATLVYGGMGTAPTCSELAIDWLSDPAIIYSVEDVPDDQGKQVSVSWTRSSNDFPGVTFPIVEYVVYREIDPDITGRFLAPALEGWDSLLAVPATQSDTYTSIVPTLVDSTIVNGNYFTIFKIRATSTDPFIYFDSPPDSGYSLDNIAPAAPTGLTAHFNTGQGNHLIWNKSPEPDLYVYRIYRSTDEVYTPGPVTFVDETSDTSWHDTAWDGWVLYYKVAAVDSGGNESDPTSPDSETATNDLSGPERYSLYQNLPNPFNPTTTIVYDVPAGGGRVTIDIYDVSGKRVRTLVDGIQTKGVKRVFWDGRNSHGAGVASGVYFYRMTAPQFTQTRKMVLLR